MSRGVKIVLWRVLVVRLNIKVMCIGFLRFFFDETVFQSYFPIYTHRETMLENQKSPFVNLSSLPHAVFLNLIFSIYIHTSFFYCTKMNGTFNIDMLMVNTDIIKVYWKHLNEAWKHILSLSDTKVLCELEWFIVDLCFSIFILTMNWVFL